MKGDAATQVPTQAEIADKARVRQESAPVLARDDILAIQDIEIAQLYVDAWSANIYIRALSGTERDAFEQSCQDQTRGKRITIKGLKTRLVIASACDIDGKPMFTLEDLSALQEKSGAAIDQIFKAAQGLSGMTNKDIEDLAGNSSSDRNGAPGCASQSD